MTKSSHSKWSTSYIPKAGERIALTINGVEYAFRWIPAGEFIMGSSKREQREATSAYVKYGLHRSFANELRHRASISRGFWMLESPITQEMWQTTMGDNPSYFRKGGLFSSHKKHPVEQVSWDDCQEYVRILNRLGACPNRRYKFSLPTEAEWERACRAGTETAYYFGETLSSREANCCFALDQGDPHKSLSTTRVGRYPANAWGLVDMHGNVNEWVQDVMWDYPKGDVVDYLALGNNNPEQGEQTRIVFDGSDVNAAIERNDSYRKSRRVIRGGAWDRIAVGCRSAQRACADQDRRSKDVGARLVLRCDSRERGNSKPSVERVNTVM